MVCREGLQNTSMGQIQTGGVDDQIHTFIYIKTPHKLFFIVYIFDVFLTLPQEKPKMGPHF